MMESDSKPGTRNAPTQTERAVLDRYARGAERVEPGLCCPSDGYEARFLEMLPREIIERDYGCGDPSRWIGNGEVVLDLGSGSGKVCYILAQKVGAAGQVIGLDFNDAMLALARKHQPEMTARLGCGNLRFHKARIQDLSLDLEAVELYLKRHPVTTLEELSAFEAHCDRLRRSRPLIADSSVDAVVSNCVMNLVRAEHRSQLFAEVFRVLKRGGRAVISDIVCDEDPGPDILADPDLWSGCIAGAFREDLLLGMLEEAGFHGMEVLDYGSRPWRTIQGIEFRSMTLRAFKGKRGPCLERNQAVIYKGPWKEVRDDDGHVYLRGRRMAVCEKTFRLLTNPAGPYARRLAGVEPRVPVAPTDASPFDCGPSSIRDPRVTKGSDYRRTENDGSPCCGDGECC